jgi:hypothetical protein
MVVERGFAGQHPNTVVFDANGQVTHQFSVGDGVEAALVDESGDLWVSYYDQGIYSGDELSSHGLNRFSVDGTLIWSFPRDAGLAPISDCYALNVDGAEAWAYYYSPFDVVRVKGDRTDVWQTPVAFARGLLIDPAGVLLVGSRRAGTKRYW